MKIIKLMLTYLSNLLILCLIFREIDLANIFISIQFVIIEYYLFKIAYIILENNRIKNSAERIDKNDKEKYKYFRDTLKELTIAEIGYLYKKSNTNELIASTLESLIQRNIITLKNKKIIVIDNSKLNLEEEYLIKNFANIKNDKFKDKFKIKINESLIKKGYIENHTRVNSIIGPQTVFIIWAFLGSYGVNLTLTYENKIKSFLTPICFLILFIVLLAYGLCCSIYDSKMCLRTEKGNELYLKLLGLKNFINDFGNFDKKTLDEIVLWEEYVLYAIVLNNGNSLDKNIKEKYKSILEIVT